MFQVTDSFSDFKHGAYHKGQMLTELPDGADWLKAGFVVDLDPKPIDEPIDEPVLPIDESAITAFLSGSVEDVAARVATCDDAALLSAAREKATRKGVQSAIDARLAEIE